MGWLVGVTEVLGAARGISFWPVLAAWVIPAVVVGAMAVRERAGIVRRLRVVRVRGWEGVVLGMTVVCLGWSAVQAWRSAPAVPDALAYHLPRQVMWMQERSVADYGTSCLRQLVMPPLAEYAGLHLMVLTGSDGAHNFIQWMALVMTAVAVSLIVRRKDGSVMGQLVGVFAVVAVPMAFMQASNTKNDVVVALWASSSLYFVWKLCDGFSWRTVGLIGLSFGALLLTKGTGAIFGLPIAVFMGFLLARYGWRRSVMAVGMVAGIVLCVNGTFWLRNERAFGSVVPNDPAIHGGDVVTNEDFSAAGIASNVVRNLAPHFVMPSDGYNAGLMDLVMWIHGVLGRDVNDPRTTYSLGRLKRYVFLQDYEELAVEPAQMYMLLLLPVGLWMGRKRIPVRAVLVVLGVVGAEFLLFSALLKWQVWHVRLVITMPILLAPAFVWGRTRAGAAIMAGVLLLVLMPSMNTHDRALLGKESILEMPYAETRLLGVRAQGGEDAVKMIVRGIEAAHPGVVGFDTGWSSEDYLIERLLLDQMRDPPRT